MDFNVWFVLLAVLGALVPLFVYLAWMSCLHGLRVLRAMIAIATMLRTKDDGCSAVIMGSATAHLLSSPNEGDGPRELQHRLLRGHTGK